MSGPWGGIQRFTWAQATAAGAAASNNGQLAVITDLGPHGTLMQSDGSNWNPVGGVAVLAQSAIPVILQSSGSVGNNGALSGLTALGATYSDGCYMYFPADKIAVGVPAGLYYVVMSSTTAGTIYNNTYTSGDPSIPASPTAFATTGPGAYTQTTNEITAISIPLLGGVLGSSGAIEAATLWSVVNNGNSKTAKVKMGNAIFQSLSLAAASSLNNECRIRNRTAASQVCQALFNQSYNGTTTAVTYGSVNTAADTTLTLTMQLANAADYQIVSGYTFKLVRP